MHKMHEPRFVAYNDGGRLFFGTSELWCKLWIMLYTTHGPGMPLVTSGVVCNLTRDSSQTCIVFGSF
jgi:hypothetical protein